MLAKMSETITRETTMFKQTETLIDREQTWLDFILSLGALYAFGQMIVQLGSAFYTLIH